MTYKSAEQVETSERRQYHIGMAPGEVAQLILLVGDPERADLAASELDAVRIKREHREYRIYTGTYRGEELTIASVGMGAGAMEIAVVELCEIVAAPIFVRAGSSGALQPDMRIGDLVVTQGALRMERASLGYVDEGFPAYAHAEVQVALVRACEEEGARYHLGVTATAAGFYGAQGRNAPGFHAHDLTLLDRLARQSVKNLEMETSCLLTLAALRGARAGAVCAVFASRTEDVFISEEQRHPVERSLVRVGLSSLLHLARMQRERGARPHWHDGLVK